MRTGNHAGRVIDKSGDYEIIECENCGFVHAYPFPDKAELDKFYRNEFQKNKSCDIDRYFRQLYWWKMHFNRRLDLIERLLSGPGKMLDIGCGFGFFIKEAQGRGWKAVGLEPSIYACEKSKEYYVDVRNCGTDLAGIEQFSDYDAVVLAHVLEHVPDPVEMLTKARKTLRPGGILVVIVANDYNPLQLIAKERLGSDSWWVCPPEHINYFNVDTIEALLESLGFEVAIKETTFPIELFLLAGLNYIDNQNEGPKAHKYQEEIEFAFHHSNNWDLLPRMFGGEGIGRNALLLGRK